MKKLILFVPIVSFDQGEVINYYENRAVMNKSNLLDVKEQ